MFLNRDDMLVLAAYVVSSTYRKKALQVLGDNEVMTPKGIAGCCNVSTNHISNTLSELKEKELVVCINPEMKKGRLYKLTSLGSEVLDFVPIITG